MRIKYSAIEKMREDSMPFMHTHGFTLACGHTGYIDVDDYTAPEVLADAIDNASTDICDECKEDMQNDYLDSRF